ncbi:hypothetical protein ACFPRL_10995 [Pseudoclavibacter helvolus]
MVRPLRCPAGWCSAQCSVLSAQCLGLRGRGWRRLASDGQVPRGAP